MYLQCSTAKTANQQKLFENALISLMQSEDFEKITEILEDENELEEETFE